MEQETTTHDTADIIEEDFDKEFSKHLEHVNTEFNETIDENNKALVKIINDALDSLDNHIQSIKTNFLDNIDSEDEAKRNEAKSGLFNLEILDNSNYFIERYKELKFNSIVKLDSEILLKSNIDKIRRLARRYKIKALKLKEFEQKLLKHKRYLDNKKLIIIYLNVVLTVIYNHPDFKDNVNNYRLFLILIVKLLSVSLALNVRLKAVKHIYSELV